MSAVPRPAAAFARMTIADLDEVTGIEESIYSHPWTRGNFVDSLRAGYRCETLRVDGRLLGYFVLLAAAGEAHLLNFSIAADVQRRGYGSHMLDTLLAIARDGGAGRIFLEVRPSNDAGRALYGRFKFVEIGRRRDYYPAHGGREDALVLSRAP